MNHFDRMYRKLARQKEEDRIRKENRKIKKQRDNAKRIAKTKKLEQKAFYYDQLVGKEE